MLVIDAQSTDATVALARDFGADVVVRPWAGFVATRRFALAQVRTPWTFMLDADEALDAEATAALHGAAPGPETEGFTLARATYFCGRPMRGAPWGGETPLRLFRTGAARLEAHPAGGGAADIHESWSVAGERQRLAGVLHHHSYPTLAAYREKFARYTSLEAGATRGSWPRLARAAARAIARIPWLFILRGGWRDGWRGAFVVAASAFYPVCVAFKALRR